VAAEEEPVRTHRIAAYVLISAPSFACASDTPTGSLVEGMGFGAFNHFWATGGDSLYEVGGGDLTTYIEPAPTG
jgi:hypothetical protein